MEPREILVKREKKVVYREGNQVFKVFDTSYPKADILNEALNQARIEETGLPIPKIMGVSVNGQGEWTIAQEYVEGKTMAQLMEEQPEKEERYIEQLVEIQLLIHSKTAPLLTKLKDKLDDRIAGYDGLKPSVRYTLRGRLASMPKHAKVLHGDFNPSNVVVREDGSYCVLDWAHATQGNATADAANTFLMLRLRDEKTAEFYLKAFCEKTNTAQQYVRQWLPIMAAMRKMKEMPEEQALLDQWLGALEY